MHSVGFELTKLNYTRLEDNLIRHRGDQLGTYKGPSANIGRALTIVYFYYNYLPDVVVLKTAALFTMCTVVAVIIYVY